MTYRYPDSRLIIFAKAPVAGKVKTRLLGKITEQQAANLHKLMLGHAVEMLLASRLAPVSLYCHPDTSHELFQSYGRRGVRLEQQSGEDLGTRMSRAFETTLAQARSVVLIGSDSPAMDEHYLSTAFRKLMNHEIVIGPAEDGGYVLVGQSDLNAQMFRGISWGGADVMANTRKLLREGGSNWSELDTLWDVDRPSDLERKELVTLLHGHLLQDII